MRTAHLSLLGLALLTACEGGRSLTDSRSEVPIDLQPIGSLCVEQIVFSVDPLANLLDATDILPVLTHPIPRGRLQHCRQTGRSPSNKIIDGNPSDWVGRPSRIGGSTQSDAGELIHSDFLFDAYGADDGTDAQRLAFINPLADIDARIGRFDALMQAAGDQLGVPEPIGASDRYGNSVDLSAEADLYELRWATSGESVQLLARWTTLTKPDNAQLLILIDSAEGGGGDIGYGLSSQRFEFSILLSARQTLLKDLATGSEISLSTARVAVDAGGWTNALEASLPASLFPSGSSIGVLSLASTDSGLIPANVMYRDSEPVSIYNEQQQALALGAGNVDGFGHPLDLQALRAAESRIVRPSAGYHERQFVSGENISSEGGENGRLQPYGLYIPTRMALGEGGIPLDIWLHYRGGKAHSGAAWTPRLIQQLGEEPGHVVVTPRGRGTSTWYVTQAHQDVFEVLDDVHALLPMLDSQRRYLSGYSMGGYGTYLFGLLYPDMFSAGYSTSGAVTQGAWTGLGPDDFSCQLPGGEIPGVGSATSPCFVEANEGNANAQLNYRLLENALHFPIVIHHGSNDELALTPGATRMGLRLQELGYRFDMTTFLGYEHFTQAIVDEWADGVAYLHRFHTPQRPRQVTYKVVPALVHSLNTVRAGDVSFDYNPDGAWWVDELIVRDADVDDPSQFGMIDVTSLALPGEASLSIPSTVDVRPDDPALSTPVLSVGAHSTPYLRLGLEWLPLGPEPLSNGFAATLTGLAHASLDVYEMGLDGEQPMQGIVTTDGPTFLVLRRLPPTAQVSLNGEPYIRIGDSIRFPLEAGIHVISW